MTENRRIEELIAELRRRLRARDGTPKTTNESVADKIVGACRAMRAPLASGASAREAAREHRASLRAAKDALEGAALAAGPLLAYYNSPGIPIGSAAKIAGIMPALRAAIATVDAEISRLGSGVGRGKEHSATGLARMILLILQDHRMNQREHRGVVSACFDELEMAGKFEGAFRRARAQVTTGRNVADS